LFLVGKGNAGLERKTRESAIEAIIFSKCKREKGGLVWKGKTYATKHEWQNQKMNIGDQCQKHEQTGQHGKGKKENGWLAN